MQVTTEIDPTEPRHGGNSSSAAAFASGKARHQGERERIFALIESSPAGLTSKEIGRLLHKEIHTFSGRLTQLKQAWRIAANASAARSRLWTTFVRGLKRKSRRTLPPH